MDPKKSSESIKRVGFEKDEFFSKIWKHQISTELVRGTVNRKRWWNEIQNLQPEFNHISPDYIWEEVFAHPVIDQTVLDLVSEVSTDLITGILSNADAGSKEKIIKQVGNTPFDHILVSSDFGFVKPEPEIYHKSLEVLGVNPEDCLFFDDREKNVEGAMKLGINAYFYENVDQVRQKLDELLTSK